MIQFDITSGEVLEYGYKYDIGTEQIEFSGFAKDDEANLVYLVFDNGQHYLIPLTDTFSIDVGSPLTDVYGKAQGQLVEMSTDGLFVKNSNIFEIYVKRSICRDETSDVSNTALATLYAQLYVMYQQIVEQADKYATKDDLEAEVGVAVEEYITEHPIEAPVTSVNSQIGDVVLTASDVGALSDDVTIPSATSELTNDSGYITSSDVPVKSVNGKVGAVTIDVPTKTSELQNDSGFLTSAVTSFNNQTGAVTYTAPVTSVNGKTGDVIIESGGDVDSVNGKTGVVVLTASDVGALADTTEIPSATSDLTNDSGFITASDVPVKSVNNKTGAITLTASDVGALPDDTVIPTKTSDLTNDSGFLTSAGAVTSFNGNTGAVTYTAPVISVNGATGAVVISAATTSANGLMSATDKSHLDAVYADYSSALTALGV